MASLLSYLLPFTPYPYVGEKVPCDLCGSAETVLVCENDRRFKRLRTVACGGCGLLRTDPMPTSAEVTAYYRDTYRFDYQFARSEPSRRHLNRSLREATDRLQRLTPALRPGARILDFGCGAGVFLGLAAGAGYTVRGIEPGQDYATYARRTYGVEVINDVWENIQLPPRSFDAITAVEVFEHLRQPVVALRWLASLLADDGVIYLTVPDMAPNDKEAFRRFHFAHLHGFTAQTLRWAGAVAGLEPDPRLTQVGTTILFRKARAAADPAIYRRGEGALVQKLYPPVSLARHVFTGRWLTGRLRQIRKTVRDTVRS